MSLPLEIVLLSLGGAVFVRCPAGHCMVLSYHDSAMYRMESPDLMFLPISPRSCPTCLSR